MIKVVTDQAGVLRSMQSPLAEGSAELQIPMTRVLSITSGKGGVGKTVVVSNIAVSLAKQGKKVLIIDANLSLANIDVVLGILPEYNLNHFFNGEKTLEEVMVEGPYGLKILLENLLYVALPCTSF